LIAPAGEMWSVVIESPSSASARAAAIGSTPGGSAGIRSKKLGWRT